MCGRYLLSTPAEVVAQVFGISRIRPLPALSPRYNIAPTQAVPIIRAETEGGRKIRTLGLVQWGLVPHWADDPSIGSKLLNARSESADTKPAFRTAFQRRRCLVPADGFYEWKKVAPKTKQPMLIRAADHKPFAMAGLWERWRPKHAEDSEQGETLETCTVLTCGSNELLADVHDRMPVILHPQDYDRWLDPDLHDPAALRPLLTPFPAGELEMFPVGRQINSPAHDSPECAQPLPGGTGRPGQQGLFL